MRYKVGDKVKVRPNLRKYEKCGKSYVVDCHLRHCGEVMRVLDVFTTTREYSLAGAGEKIVFSEEMLEPVEKVVAGVPVSTKNNPVSHPSHYTDGRIEVIDFIQDKGLNFCRGNIVKYVSRAGKKGDKAKEIEDLKKARQYCDFEINRLEGRV